jgi:hypothetical protein
LFDDGSHDAAFIDGGHSYSNVLADIDAYLPKIRKKGIMFGHDLHDLPSRLDRRELLNVSDLNHAEVTYITSDGLSQRLCPPGRHPCGSGQIWRRDRAISRQYRLGAAGLIAVTWMLPDRAAAPASPANAIRRR